MKLISDSPSATKAPSDSLGRRYGYKLLANLVGLPMALIVQAIIPRGLGPAHYGDFNFLTNFFSQLVSFVEMGTSIGFYTKLSQRPTEGALVRFYVYFAGLVALAVLVLVAVTQLTSTYARIWPNQKIVFVYLAAVWGLFAWFIQIIEKMGDAYGLTVSIEITRMVQKFVGMALIVILFIWGQLNLGSLFFYYYFIFGLMIAGSLWVMGYKGYSLRRGWKISSGQVKLYLKELYHYSHPLFVYGLVGLLANLFDRWLLQVSSGSTQQGFYGLSYQIGAICFLFTGAMTPLLTREFAISFGKSDLPEMARLFRKFVPVFYALAAFFSCYVAVQADKVVRILGGKSFSEAYVAVIIMAFYPVYQTYGQLSSSVFFATGQTAIYRNIGIIFLLAGLPLTYFLIAPRHLLGLDAGATGLAIKMVLLQIIGVNVQLYFNSRLLGLRFWRYVGHQVFSLICLLVLAFLIVRGMDITLPIQTNVLLSFCLSGVIYTLVVLGLVYLKPVIFGLKREDLHYFKEKFINKHLLFK